MGKLQDNSKSHLRKIHSVAALSILSTLMIASFGYTQKHKSQQEKREDSSKNETTAYQRPQGKEAAYGTLCLKKNMAVLSVDFLYWQPEISGLTSGLRLSQPNPATSNFKPEEFDFKWGPGFRVGLGARMGWHDCWMLFANWTHFHGEGSSSAKSRRVGEMLSPSAAGFLINPTTHYRSVQSTHYDTVDLDLSEHYHPSKHFSLSPFAGIRGAKIDQQLHSKMEGFQNIGAGEIALSNVGPQSVYAKCDFQGIGARAGTKIQWYFNRNWSLMTTFAGAFLRGIFHVKETASFIQVSNSSRLTEKVSDRLWRNQLNFEGGLGLQWRLLLNKNRNDLSITALYEMSYWPTMNRLITLQGGGPNSSPNTSLSLDDDVSFQGLSLNFTFGF